MIRALLNRRRVEQTRREVAAIRPRDPERQRLRLLLISLLDVIALLHCRPGRERDFDQVWECVEFFRDQLEAPASRRLRKASR